MMARSVADPIDLAATAIASRLSLLLAGEIARALRKLPAGAALAHFAARSDATAAARQRRHRARRQQRRRKTRAKGGQ
jgi:hypothetical protein